MQCGTFSDLCVKYIIVWKLQLTQQSIDDSEIELDFESLGDMCLREMAAFMKTIEMKPAKDEDENPKPFRPAAPTISEKAPSAAPSTSSKPEKKSEFFISYFVRFITSVGVFAPTISDYREIRKIIREELQHVGIIG